MIQNWTTLISTLRIPHDLHIREINLIEDRPAHPNFIFLREHCRYEKSRKVLSLVREIARVSVTKTNAASTL